MNLSFTKTYSSDINQWQSYWAISMKETNLLIKWLYCRDNDTITVCKDIRIVCNTLRNEGACVNVERVKIPEGSSEIITLEEVEEEPENIDECTHIHSLEVDLTQSFISMRKFNELIQSWGTVEMK